MQMDVLQAKWKHFRTVINSHWTELDSDDLDRVHGKRDNLVFLLETKYGFARRRAEREVERVITEFENMLRRAA